MEKIKQQEDYRSLMGIYHVVQLAAAVIVDLVAMMNKDLAELVQDNYQNLEYLQQEGIIKQDLKLGIKEIVGLRNRLAHEYNGIIDEIAWESVVKNQKYFKSFHQVVTIWLDQQRQ